MAEKCVGVLGATSLVGRCVISLLGENGWQVKAFSRSRVGDRQPCVHWVKLQMPVSYQDVPAGEADRIAFWICVAPIWILPHYFSMLESYGVSRVIALSSTSRFTKFESSALDEKATAQRISESEDRLQSWAQQKKVHWVILRPTLIYGWGQDKNISEIIRLIRRLGFFPTAGQAKGLRQPVHAGDVAMACTSALENSHITNKAYNLPGGETLTYREMINRLFAALGRRPRVMALPLWSFRLASAVLHFFPRYRSWNVQMARRMNTDLVFDGATAARDLHYNPRKFILTPEDIPVDRIREPV